MILEYMMIKELGNLVTPSWVENGGYFQNPDDFTFIGYTPDEGDREYYVPDTVVSFTVPELKTRMLGIHAKHPMKDLEGNTLTAEQVNQMVDDWATMVGEA